MKVTLSCGRLPEFGCRGRVKRNIKGIRERDWPLPERARKDLALRGPTPAYRAIRPEEWSSVHAGNVFGVWGLAMAWLRSNGALDWDVPPAQRFPKGKLHEYIVWLEEAGYASETIRTYLENLYCAVSVLDPEGDHSQFDGARLHRGKRTPRRPGEVGGDPERVRQRADKLLVEGRALCASGDARGVWFVRDAVLLHLVIPLGLRRKEFGLLTFGGPEAHIYPFGGEYRLRFRAHETKGGTERDDPLDANLAKLVLEYVGLCGELLDHRWGDRPSGLWLSRKGGVLGVSAVCRIVRQRAAGLSASPLTVHRCRKIGTATIAEQEPASIGAAAEQLAHVRSVNGRHYNAATTFTASVRYNNWMEAFVDVLRKKDEGEGS
jgi:hypothetical protein